MALDRPSVAAAVDAASMPRRPLCCSTVSAAGAVPDGVDGIVSWRHSAANTATLLRMRRGRAAGGRASACCARLGHGADGGRTGDSVVAASGGILFFRGLERPLLQPF
eukprot:scaffold3980_cov348-Prasinococcus_capsulatus_cf.AAC.4